MRPEIEERILPEYSAYRMSRYDIICIHTMVGTLDGVDRYFRNTSPNVNSHFGIGGNGKIVQWVPLSHRSAANSQGNHRIISIETEDMGDAFPRWAASDVPSFTFSQVDALAQLISWLCGEYEIPLELVPDSRPNRRGIGYHRQGIDPWRVMGGERWSLSRGKVCPGDRRIYQIPHILELAGVEDMTPEQARKLDVVYEQITGNDFKGWDKDWLPTNPDGSIRQDLTLVDLVRYSIHLNGEILRRIGDLGT